MLSTSTLRRKRRWSLVRIFVSFIPEVVWKYIMPQPIRIHFNQNINTLMPRVKCDMCQLHNSPKNFQSFKSYLSRSNKTSEMDLNSTPKLNVTNNDSRISDIQKDLQELKDQVAKILRQQQEKSHMSDYGSLQSSPKDISTPSTQCQSSPIYNAPPPPPPPPLPSYLITAKPTCPIVIKRKEEKPRLRPPVRGFPGGDELLRDLKKVQLKKIQKSPGGGPLKKEKPAVEDPANFLEKVLKKRFNSIQSVSSDASPDSSVDVVNDSFSSDLFQKNMFGLCNGVPTSAS